MADLELNEVQKRRIREKVIVERGKIHLIDKAMYITELVRSAEAKMNAGKIDYILIDFLQAFIYSPKRQVEELTAIMKNLHQLSNKYLIPIFYLSQVNDRDEGKQGAVKLDKGDLKGSGSIEEFSRHIIMIQGSQETGDKEFNVVKNTFGEVKLKKIAFDHSTGRLMCRTDSENI